MATPETESHSGLGTTAKQVSEHASSLVRLEMELAVLEVKSKLASLGRGVAFAVGAVVLFLFAFGFGAGTAAAGIATATSPWVGLLVVTFFLLLFAVLLGALAAWSIKKGAPPVPEQAIREAKLTSEVLKNDGSSQ